MLCSHWLIVVGQERRIIIISTVRSSTEYIATDVVHNLGNVSPFNPNLLHCSHK
jgi:hypothetical protein